MADILIIDDDPDFAGLSHRPSQLWAIKSAKQKAQPAIDFRGGM
jgi:hypothetical protein